MQQHEMADVGGANHDHPQVYETPVSQDACEVPSATHAPSEPGVISTTCPSDHAYESIMPGGKGNTERPTLKAGIPGEPPLKAGHPQLLLTISEVDSEYELMESTKLRSESYRSAEAGHSDVVGDNAAIDPQLQYVSPPSPVLVQDGDFSISAASAY